MGGLAAKNQSMPTWRRIRVLRVAFSLHGGGLERVVSDLIARLDPDRFESHLLCLEYLGRHAPSLTSVATLHVTPRQSRWSMIRPTRLARQIRGIDPDLVHTHSGTWYKTARATHMAGSPVLIYTDHGRYYPGPWTEKALTRLASALTASIVAVSHPLADYRSRVTPRHAGHRLVVTIDPNGK